MVQKRRAKVKAKKAQALSGWQSLDLVRCGALARLYAWLADDLAEWQASHGGAGNETEGDCPVVVEIHNEACRKLYDSIIDLAEATKVATATLTTNVRGKPYVDPVTNAPFVFVEEEIAALAKLMMERAFIALAPYRPLGALEMW